MILALDRGSVQPDNYSRDVTFYILTALVLGGLAKVTGLDRRADAVLGPVRVHRQLPERARRQDGRWRSAASRSSRSTQVGQITFALVGLLLMLLMMFRPQGLFGNRKEMALDGR